jgi:hypothetical protein
MANATRSSAAVSGALIGADHWGAGDRLAWAAALLEDVSLQRIRNRIDAEEM